MTWDDIAAPHVDHKAKLTDTRHLRCFDCAVTLVLPREPRVVTVTSPAPYKAPDRRDLPSPELIAYRKAQALAAVEHARQKRTTVDPS